jgi:hypothetical protein
MTEERSEDSLLRALLDVAQNQLRWQQAATVPTVAMRSRTF